MIYGGGADAGKISSEVSRSLVRRSSLVGSIFGGSKNSSTVLSKSEGKFACLETPTSELTDGGLFFITNRGRALRRRNDWSFPTLRSAHVHVRVRKPTGISRRMNHICSAT